MFIRGSGSGEEYRRTDNSFYRGIVVKNNDPDRMNRVKVYIPELTNQPYDEWFVKFENFNLKAMGDNANPKTESEKKTNIDFSDVDILDKISDMIPWAEPCYPVIGESGSFRYYKDGKLSVISDSNYGNFRENDNDTISLESGAFSPAFLYENFNTTMGDTYTNPTYNMTGKCNPYAFSYRPSKHVNKSKGVFAVPEVGSKVWVFHYTGDLQFPVYFGVTQDYRSISIMNNTDNEKSVGSEYPSKFEN